LLQTQYGNILRVRPDDEKSPLLEPENVHKQLIVIDFEYASQNLPALEFANHFTEWTYNYHDATTPYACNAERYPTPEEQHRFIKAYLDHRPQFPHAGTPKLLPQSGSVTPKLLSTPSASSIKEFMLDARAPPEGWREEERRHEARTEQQVQELMEETRLWRVANSAQWVAWGIVQAKVPELEAVKGAAEQAGEHDLGETAGDNTAEADEFDYLSYAQDRAMFFLGDCVLLGFVDKAELPEDVQQRLKLVEY
jgi:choline kinase